VQALAIVVEPLTMDVDLFAVAVDLHAIDALNYFSRDGSSWNCRWVPSCASWNRRMLPLSVPAATRPR
jgi:hypothetical protein